MTTIVFGCPPGLRVARADVQRYLDRRRPGSSRHGTPRQEADKVIFLSGLYAEGALDALLSGPKVSVHTEGKEFQTETYEVGYTTGEPIAALVLSTSQRSRHYAQFTGPQGEVRPGHTDLVKHYKSQGFVDVRGGGRSSYRSTISDVIGGSIARLFLEERFGTIFLSSIVQVGPLRTERTLSEHFMALIRAAGSPHVPEEAVRAVEAQLDGAEIRSIDPDFAQEAAALIKRTRIEGDSLGAAVEVVAVNPPALVGEPLYDSLKKRLMGALGGLHAAQSCEVGDGYDVVARRGSENNDPIRRSGYQTNSHGGLIGGITTGMPLVCRVGFKPTSTIVKPQKSVRKDLEEIDFALQKGRHDPCVGVRAGVTLESRMAVEVMNGVLMHQASRVDPEQFRLF
ncbi:MAG: chorismate synthase [Caldilineae bacterium]|nr:MAG: chorismate synthase [Caldilineae bacterium]